MNSALNNKTEFLAKLYLGDCLEIMKEIPDGSVDLVLCDPPYGTTACKWDSVISFVPLWEQYWRVCKPNAAVLLFGSSPFSNHLYLSQMDHFKYELVWVKNRPTGAMLCEKRPMKAHETISVFYKSQPTYNPQKIPRTENELKRLSRNSTMNKASEAIGGGMGSQKRDDMKLRHPDSVLHFDCVFSRSKEKTPHPSQKPVALLEYLIKTYSHPGDTILDNAMGSGSTGVAAKLTDRQFVGIEKEPKYFEIAEERLGSA